jgi:hypothetical protein
MKKYIIILSVLLIGGSIARCGCAYIGNAQKTAFNEFKPEELLRKYEWFKNASASLDSRRSNIRIYEKKLLRANSIPYEKLDRVDKENINIWEQELAGVKSSYNSLASEYNAQMSKFNWRFCNSGGLPQGATEVLPREFKSYLDE